MKYIYIYMVIWNILFIQQKDLQNNLSPPGRILEFEGKTDIKTYHYAIMYIAKR